MDAGVLNSELPTREGVEADAAVAESAGLHLNRSDEDDSAFRSIPFEHPVKINLYATALPRGQSASWLPQTTGVAARLENYMRYLWATAVIGLALAGTTQGQPDPFTGTWKLNVAKSKMQPATASQRETLVLTVVGDEETLVTDAVTSAGEPEVMKYTARYDGKIYPGTTTISGKTVQVQKMNVVLHKIDTRTRERVGMADGKVTFRARRVLSEDGKTLTSTILSVDDKGKEIVREIRVFERQ